MAAADAEVGEESGMAGNQSSSDPVTLIQVQCPENQQVANMQKELSLVANLAQKNQDSISDLRRYNMKSDLVLSGKALPMEAANDNCIEMFCQLVWRFFHVKCNPNNIAQCHWLKKKGKRLLLARFIWLGKHSGMFVAAASFSLNVFIFFFC